MSNDHWQRMIAGRCAYCVLAGILIVFCGFYLSNLFDRRMVMVLKNPFRPPARTVEMEQADPLETNPEQRSPFVFVFDKSISMRGRKIQELNQGLRDIEHDVKLDEVGCERLEIAIVTFGPVTVTDFVLAKDFVAPTLEADGYSPLCKALMQAGDLVKARMHQYRKHEIDRTRPVVFGITDGEPDFDESLDEVREMIRAFETAPNEMERAAFFLAGVEGANMEVLSQISYRKPMPLNACKIRQMMRWCSTSMSAVSRSMVGGSVELPSPLDWMKLD
jgi:uncharacterized protein YegL